MKARNPNTGNLETVYVKALDSMPVGTEVDFDGTSADIPTGWEEISEYSTTEINTGKVWIDSKPIYRKVITGNYNDNATILSNISTLINISGTGDCGTGVTRLLPYYEIYNNQPFICTLNKQSNNITFVSKLEGTSHIGSLNIVVEYTKTTD